MTFSGGQGCEFPLLFGRFSGRARALGDSREIVLTAMINFEQSLPILFGTLILMLGDLHSNTLFFDPIFGDPIFYQHFLWTSRSFRPKNSCIWHHFQNNFWDFTFAKQSMIFAMSCTSLLWKSCLIDNSGCVCVCGCVRACVRVCF